MRKYASSLLLLAVLLGTNTEYLSAQGKGKDAQPWWRHAVFYEVYVRSFADSNGDGLGDLNGITSKLDYLQKLGVDAIWLSPCFPSPQFDFGYDVSDYRNIDPMYGTLQDFDRLAQEAHRRNIRVIMDFVLNHTSSQHPWFLQSKSSRQSPYRDWYVWRSGKGPGKPPSNWQSSFGGPAWTYDSATDQYYYHYFEVQQPDLNWRNPAVEKAMFDIVDFWHQHGVDGFRLDAVDTLFEDPDLRDNPTKQEKNEFGDVEMTDKYNDKLPEVHDVLRRLRKVADRNDQVLIGETWTENIEELRQYYGPNNDEISLPMDFMFTSVKQLSATEFRRQIDLVESTGGWPVFVISNHDIVRPYTRYSDGKHNEEIAKLMAAMYLTLRGTPILYYGEELGMENHDPVRREDVKDPLGQQGWPVQKGRDGERTPMQWTAGTNAGFTEGKPWLAVAPAFTAHNVAVESDDAHSVLQFYRSLLKLRRNTPALLEGSYVPLNRTDTKVLSYLRRHENEAVIVLLNMSAEVQQAEIDLSAAGFPAQRIGALLASQEISPVIKNGRLSIALPPFSSFIGELLRK